MPMETERHPVGLDKEERRQLLHEPTAHAKVASLTHKRPWLTLAAILFATPLFSAAADEATILHDLHVVRHVTTPLTDEHATEIVEEMGEILVTIDGPSDVACHLGFVRTRPVEQFTTGTGTIYSKTDYYTVNNLQGNIKVVTRILWCNGVKPDVIGCAPVSGYSMVVIRYKSNQEALLWLHEFGHNKGLNHRIGKNLLMNDTIDPANRQISAKECEAFRVS